MIRRRHRYPRRFLIVYAFTISIYASSRAQPETLNRAALAIVDEDNSPVSTRIITAFNPPYFSIPKLWPRRTPTSSFLRKLYCFAAPVFELSGHRSRRSLRSARPCSVSLCSGSESLSDSLFPVLEDGCSMLP